MQSWLHSVAKCLATLAVLDETERSGGVVLILYGCGAQNSCPRQMHHQLQVSLYDPALSCAEGAYNTIKVTHW